MNLDYVEAKNVSVDILSHMVGYYRVWRFDENYDIVQSMLHIGEEYQIYCYSNQYENKNYNKQVCLININKDDVPFPNKTICMTTHPKAGTGLIAHLMIKLLPVVIRKVRTLQENITGGVVCFAGREENGFPFKSAIVLLKEEDPASINNETFWKTIEKNQIKGEIGENAGLQILYEKLKELEIGNYDLFKELP